MWLSKLQKLPCQILHSAHASILPDKKETLNANQEKQFRFIQLKGSTKQSYTKPTFEEIRSTKEKLSKADVVDVQFVLKKTINAVISMWNGFSVKGVKLGCTVCVLIKMM